MAAYSIGDTVAITNPHETGIPRGTRGTVTDAIPCFKDKLLLVIKHPNGTDPAFAEEVSPA